MSRSSIPAAFSVSSSFAMSAVLAVSASRAVAPCEVTPEVTIAVSGRAATSPMTLDGDDAGAHGDGLRGDGEGERRGESEGNEGGDDAAHG